VVARSWFFNTDGSNKYNAAQDAGGTRFSVQVTDCDDIASVVWQANYILALHHNRDLWQWAISRYLLTIKSWKVTEPKMSVLSFFQTLSSERFKTRWQF
jgi:hypothetical protein